MNITRDELIKRLSEKSGYFQKDLKKVFRALDDVMYDCFNEVTDDEEVLVHIVKGVKIGCSIQPERVRKDPRTQDDIVCKPCCKPKTRYSEDFRKAIQENYEAKHG